MFCLQSSSFQRIHQITLERNMKMLQKPVVTFHYVHKISNYIMFQIAESCHFLFIMLIILLLRISKSFTPVSQITVTIKSKWYNVLQFIFVSKELLRK